MNQMTPPSIGLSFKVTYHKNVTQLADGSYAKQTKKHTLLSTKVQCTVADLLRINQRHVIYR
jgi:hypothetical protein